MKIKYNFLKNDIWKIEKTPYIYRTRYYKIITEEEKEKLQKKDVKRINKHNCVLVYVDLITIDDKKNIIKKYTDKIEKGCNINYKENKLDWLASFLLAGLDYDDIVTLDEFRKFDKLRVIKTPIIEHSRNKQLKYNIININTDNQFLMDKISYDEWVVKEYGRDYLTKQYILERTKFDINKIKLSPQQKEIIECIHENKNALYIAKKIGTTQVNVCRQIDKIRKKIKNTENKKITFNKMCKCILTHMDNQNKDFSKYFKWYIKQIHEKNGDYNRFIDICCLFFTDIEKRKIYGCLKWNYQIDIKLFCKIRNNLERYLYIQNY